MTITDVARRLGISRPTVYKLIDRGKLRAVKDPLYLKGTWVRVEDVEAVEAERRAAQQGDH